MTAQQVVEIIKIMYDLGGTVEYLPEGEIGNSDICFYRKIDNTNIKQAEINALLNEKEIPFIYNAFKLKGYTIYITVYI